MTCKETIYGYGIFLAVCLLLLGILSQVNVSAWFHFIAPFLAIAASFKFIHKMSIMVVGLIVISITAVLPVMLLMAMSFSHTEPLIKHVNFLCLFNLLLPTLERIIAPAHAAWDRFFLGAAYPTEDFIVMRADQPA